MNNKKEIFVIIISIIIFTILICVFGDISNKEDISEAKSKEELIYETAQNYIAQENYYYALNELSMIPNYSDSAELTIETNYLLGKDNFNEGNINNALKYFNKITDYKDSKEFIKKCNAIEELIGSYCNENKYIMINYEWIIYVTMENGYTEQLTYEIDFDNNTIKIEDKSIKYSEDFSLLKYKNRNYIKESNYIDTSKIKYYAPKLGMTREEVLNTSWGEPQAVDNGGTWADKNNKKRTEGKWDESWYYKRNGNIIFVEFKDGEVVNFLVSLKGENSSKNLSNVDSL